jgi:hypothetical protein
MNGLGEDVFPHGPWSPDKIFVGFMKFSCMLINSGKTSLKDGPAARTVMWDRNINCQLSMVFSLREYWSHFKAKNRVFSVASMKY